MHDFSGVYHIRNALNDKVYVGQSQTVLKRLRQHYNSLVRGDHANNHLQSSFNKRGPGVFEYSALVVCGISELSVAEQQALDAVPKKLRYNRGDFVATPSRGVHISQKTRARCRQCVQEYRASKAVKPEMMLPKAYLDYEVTGL